MATKSKEPESQRISWFLYSFELPLLCMSAKRYSIAGRISAASCSSHSCSINQQFLLKDLGIGIIFEKENINTLDAKGEVLLTILSSLAQDESRSISENCTWGIRRRFETGKHKMSTKRFLGYDTDETGKLVINRTQEPIVVRLYQEFLDGKTTDYIKRIFEREGVKNWDGGTKWQSTTLMSMLENEKYKGDARIGHKRLLMTKEIQSIRRIRKNGKYKI